MSHPASRLSKVSAEAGSTRAQGIRNRTAPLRRLTQGVRSQVSKLNGVWAAALLRTASVGLTLIGLAAIGTSSVAQGLTSVSTRNANEPLRASLLSMSGQVGFMGGVPTTASSAEGHPATQGEAAPASSPPPAPEPGLTAEGKIVLNAASATILDRLPSVGRKRAEQIVALRERLGRFRSLNDLLRIRGIGPRTLDKMRPMLVLDPPAAPPAASAQPPQAGPAPAQPAPKAP